MPPEATAAARDRGCSIGTAVASFVGNMDMHRRVFLCATIALLAVSAGADDHGGRDRRVHELMERTHEGRRSPYGRLRRATQGEAAPWPEVEQAVRELEPMRRALLESPDDDIKASADGYADAVEKLAAAARRRDAAAVREGFASLAQSCGDCHFDGGVGGRLEEEHDREGEADREPGRERERRRRDRDR